MTTWIPGNVNDRSVLGFRTRHGSSRGPMSVTAYRKLKKLGIAPRETIVGGIVLVLPEDEKAWDDARRNPTNDAELKQIAATRERWHKRALAAGKAAAASPIHVSKRKRPTQSKQRKGK